MINKLTRKNLLILTILMLGIFSTSLSASIGFQASLDPYPFFVSGYDVKSERYSVALSPKSYTSLSGKLVRLPKLKSANFESNSLRFESMYFQQGIRRKYLIPLSADATSYMNYQREKADREYFSNIFNSIFTDPNRANRKKGLGINVALPKRLDKIFGEGGAGLQVSGYRRITFSGRSQWRDAAATDTYRQNKFPSLNMEQISRFNITGNIGSKITVKVSQDSQTDIPLANRLQIRYKGDDDDILKTIEAGNTNLSIPNTRFVGYNQRIQGLFGIKAEAAVGNLTLTAIASQEKGSSERTQYTPTGEESADHIRDYEFARNRIFDLAYTDSTLLGMNDPYQPGDSIIRLIVYEHVKSSSINDEAVAEAEDAQIFPEPTNPDRVNAYKDETYQIQVREIDPKNYTYEFRGSAIPYLVFKSSRTESKTIAYYMEIFDKSEGEIVTIGDISQTTTDSLYLKILSLNSTHSNAELRSWQLMWRNCYQIPRGVNVEDIDLKIFKGLTGTERSNSENPDFQETNNNTMTYLEILGLDQYNSSNEKTHDNKLDDRSEIFRADWGLIIFPHRTPFNSDTTFVDKAGNVTMPLQVKVEALYNERTRGTEIVKKSQYYLQLATRTRSSIISLNHANIIEGSEVVKLNGRQLKRNTDYSIQYDFGQITLISQEALDPNADITVDFEYAPFLSLQKKTLLGLRAMYEFNDDISFGTTLLYKSDKAQDRKPKVGQETATMVVMDLDASVKFTPNFLTKMANAFPFVETEVPSNLRITGEVAQSHPNPNVDNLAYVDDFETALDQLSLGISRTIWQIASKPYTIQAAEEEDPLIRFNRGKLLWHTPDLAFELVRTDDVFDRETKQGEGLLRTFRLVFKPDNEIVDSTINTIDQVTNDTLYDVDTTRVPSWAGMTRYFNSRVDAKRVQLFEFRAKINENAQGKLHFEFGQINEDIDIYTEHINIAFTEDGFATDGQKNGAVNDLEDVGLDGLVNEDELGYDPVTNPDPSGDNWYFMGEGDCPLPPDSCAMLSDNNSPFWDLPSIRYNWINGTEGNIRDNSVLGVPDEEALSDNGLNTINSYFSAEIDLANNQFVIDSSYKNGWLTYRIPIRDPEVIKSVVETSIEPNWEQITHVRVWFEADSTQSTQDTVEIAAWYFVQSNWQDTVIYSPISNQATKLTVATISTEDGTFRPPPGVQAYKDPTYNVIEPQRGLLFKFDSLQYLDTAMAVKELITVDQYSGYRKMKMYVNVKELSESSDSVEFFFRIGRDQLNFYEHQSYLMKSFEWDEINWIDINFQDLTSIKDSVLRAEGRRTNLDVTSGKYRVVGNPNLNEIRFFSVGVVNRNSEHAGDDTVNVSGEIWLDELRVTDVRRDVGSAARISTNGTIADLINYNFTYQTKDPYFRGISSATRGGSDQNLGSGQTETSMNYSVALNLHKFLPRSWNAKIPLRYNYSKQQRIPLLRNGTDILLPEAIRKEEETISESKKFSVSGLSFNHKGNNPLFNILLNRIRNTTFSYGISTRKAVITPYQYGENITIRSGFDFGIKKPLAIPIFFWTKWIPIAKKASNSKLGLYPSKFTINGDFNRSLTITDDIKLNRITTFRRSFTGSADLSYSLFENFKTGFRYKTVRDLSDINKVKISISDLRLGLETIFQHSFSANYDPKLLNFFTTSFGFNSSYNENYDKSFESYRSNLQRAVGISGNFNHMQLFGGGGSGASGGRRFRGRGRTNVRGGGAKQSEKKKRPFYDPPLAVMRFLTGWINPFQYKYDISFKNSIPGITIRPGLKYRFGFIDDPGELGMISQNRNPSSSESESYSLSSGFTLLGGFKTDVRFKESLNRDLISVGPRYENSSRSWPDLSIRIQKFKTLPLLKPVVNKLIDIFAPRTGYNRQVKERTNLDGSFTVDRSIVQNFKPLISINFKLIRSLSMSGSYSLTKNSGEKFNQTNGEFRSETRSNKKSIAVTTKFSFSSPGGITIPLIGKLKFKSTASIELNVKYNVTLSETAQKDKPFVASSDKSDMSISPKITYQFSSQIRGGITGRWQDTQDRRRGSTNHVREIQIWTEIHF